MGREAVLRSGGVFRRDCARRSPKGGQACGPSITRPIRAKCCRFFRDVAAARERWPGSAGGGVAQDRDIELGEASVVVVVSTPHREEAFDACRYLIDTLKATAPIWKHETWERGRTGASRLGPSRRPQR